MIDTRTITNKKIRWDKNNQQYLILELDNNETILVFANQINPNQWNDLQINESYRFTVKEGKNNSKILTSYQTVINAQEWLDQNYPKEFNEYGNEVKRSKVEEIYLNEPSLEGEIDLEDFAYCCYEPRVYISLQVDETKLTFKNLPERVEIIKCVKAQKWLDQNYPLNGTCLRKNERKEESYWKGVNNFGKTRSEITKLDISEQNLEGHLNLNDFSNLKWIVCHSNQLTSLDLSNCKQLEEINCYHNQLANLSLPRYCLNLTYLGCSSNKLTNITLPANHHANLKRLDLSSNNFPPQNLSFLTSYTNLEELDLENNNFTGSLDWLSEMRQLKKVGISNTDINEVNMVKLPRNLEEIRYYTHLRPNCKLTAIIPLLDKHFGEFGLCFECHQPNTSQGWCQPCAENEWQEDIKQLTGQELIDKLIQQQELRREKLYKYKSGSTKLEWIPYEEFTSIKHLAQGGFGEVYKAKWKGRETKERNSEGQEYDEIVEYTEVVLKFFTNSQNITHEFLTEIANTKLVDDYGRNRIVHCHGISQDPITKNYVMIMDYKEEGNLRQYLKNKNGGLSLKDKLEQLKNIIDGLSWVHNQNLIHRDFHSGNILNGHDEYNRGNESFVSDLGLSFPANYQKKEGQIFGVLPYVAPEVLQGQPYTKASDIYSFGIIAYELLANEYPYPKMDDINLALKVYDGLRPSIDKVPIPQLLKDLIKRCWDTDLKKRPTSNELEKIFEKFEIEIWQKINTPFYNQYQALEQEYNTFSQNTPYRIHPTAQLTSKMIDTKQITHLLQITNLKNTYGDSQQIDLDINDFNLDELTFQEENPQEEISAQAQIQIPPK